MKLPKGDIHHYDLSISPDKCPRRVNRDIVEAMVSTYHKVFGEQRPVFDGRKNLYSSRALPIGRKPVSLVSLDLSFILLLFTSKVQKCVYQCESNLKLCVYIQYNYILST